MKAVFRVCRPAVAAGLEVRVMLETMRHGGPRPHMILCMPGTGDYTLINRASEVTPDINRAVFQSDVLRINRLHVLRDSPRAAAATNHQHLKVGQILYLPILHKNCPTFTLDKNLVDGREFVLRVDRIMEICCASLTQISHCQ